MMFIDSRKWGRNSFVDILETNNIGFTFYGDELSFPTQSDEDRASTIWYNLTGSRVIGTIPGIAVPIQPLK